MLGYGLMSHRQALTGCSTIFRTSEIPRITLPSRNCPSGNTMPFSAGNPMTSQRSSHCSRTVWLIPKCRSISDASASGPAQLSTGIRRVAASSRRLPSSGLTNGPTPFPTSRQTWSSSSAGFLCVKVVSSFGRNRSAIGSGHLFDPSLHDQGSAGTCRVLNCRHLDLTCGHVVLTCRQLILI